MIKMEEKKKTAKIILKGAIIHVPELIIEEEE